jgi:hypothetical protein
MPIFSENKDTRRVLRDDLSLLIRLIADSRKMDCCPLTNKGQLILKLLWEENKSFKEVAETLSISKERAVQIYRFELRRLSYFLDSTIKEFPVLLNENETLKKENKELKKKLKKK